MSHFAVLVIGNDVDGQLAPYHEFECTGRDDQYVQDLDKTAELRAEYEKHTSTRYRSPKGTLYNPYLKRFYRDPTPEETKKTIGTMGGSGCGDGITWSSQDWKDGRGYRTMVHFLPEGWTEVEVPTKEFKSFKEFVQYWSGQKPVRFGRKPDLKETHKYGYVVVDEKGEVVKVIDRTNPNKKWDGYQVGGRAHGFFKMKPNRVGLLGEPGLQSMNRDYRPPQKDRADQAFKGAIDFEAMRAEGAEQAAQEYDAYKMATEGLSPLVAWDDMMVKHGVGDNSDWKTLTKEQKDERRELLDAARDAYHNQPILKAMRKYDETRWLDADLMQQHTRESYIERGRKRAVLTFAVLKDGQWYEKGKMGWWACVSDAKDEDVWADEFNKLLDSTSDDTLLTIVDCHI